MTGANVPRVSLQRTFTILLLTYCASLLLALLAGGTILAHVDPYGECLLYASDSRCADNPGGGASCLYYGSEYICDGIGAAYILIMFGSLLMFYFTFKHRRELISFYKSGEILKGDAALTISSSSIYSHAAISCAAVILAIAVTVGYQVACNNIEERLSKKLRDKLNIDPKLTRGERVDERFTDDNEFWRYSGKIGNPFGSDVYTQRITCRAVFTDPNVHQELHDNHVNLFAQYFGYWYNTDIYAYDSQKQSVITNSLIEACLAGAWMSAVVWLVGLAFMIVQKYYIKREKWAADKVSLHSGSGSMRKYEGSMISGSGYYQGGAGVSRHNSMSRPGTLSRGSRRGSVDNLALTLAGVATPRQQEAAGHSQGTPSYPGYPQQLGAQQFGAQQFGAQQFGAQQFGAPGHQYQLQQPLQAPHRHQGYSDPSEMETEIM